MNIEQTWFLLHSWSTCFGSGPTPETWGTQVSEPIITQSQLPVCELHGKFPNVLILRSNDGSTNSSRCFGVTFLNPQDRRGEHCKASEMAQQRKATATTPEHEFVLPDPWWKERTEPCEVSSDHTCTMAHTHTSMKKLRRQFLNVIKKKPCKLCFKNNLCVHASTYTVSNVSFQIPLILFEMGTFLTWDSTTQDTLTGL